MGAVFKSSSSWEAVGILLRVYKGLGYASCSRREAGCVSNNAIAAAVEILQQACLFLLA